MLHMYYISITNMVCDRIAPNQKVIIIGYPKGVRFIRTEPSEYNNCMLGKSILYTYNSKREYHIGCWHLKAPSARACPFFVPMW